MFYKPDYCNDKAVCNLHCHAASTSPGPAIVLGVFGRTGPSDSSKPPSINAVNHLVWKNKLLINNALTQKGSLTCF
jgi:hypothetical protein